MTVATVSPGVQLAEGTKTETVYGLIRDGKYSEVVPILQNELQNCPKSRAGLSLLAYCFMYMQDFHSAAACYEQLVELSPEVPEYSAHYAQALCQAGLYPEADVAAAQSARTGGVGEKMMHLQATIKYEQNDLAGAKSILDRCGADDPDTVVGWACIDYKEERYEDARQKFQDAMNALGYTPQLVHSIALCHYKLKQFGAALKLLTEIIERGVREHPELSVGAGAVEGGAAGGGAGSGVDVKSVGNSQTLKETALVEAFNLKAAIEHSLENAEAAKEALADMPPRSESELDPVTLHNIALINMDSEPEGGFRKLNFLLTQPPFPPETFANLLLSYVRLEYFDMAADVLAEMRIFMRAYWDRSGGYTMIACLLCCLLGHVEWLCDGCLPALLPTETCILSMV
eukprot:947603_1